MNLFNLLKKQSPLKKKAVDSEIINLYPNPTSGTVQVLFSTTEPRILKLYNNQDKEIILKTIDEATNIEFDLQSLPNGIYYLDIKSSTKQITKLIIKE
jgi:hypothetical protein